MNITQIEHNIKNLLENYNQETFIYYLLLAYGIPNASIDRLQKGKLNLSKNADEILWKKKLFFKVVASKDLYSTADNYKQHQEIIKHEPRFTIITDYQQLLAIDNKTNDNLDIKITELNKYFDFFLPWAGMEKATYQGENPADVKAAEKMAKLFDEIRKDNPELTSKEELHSLNVFLSRLLFCFFAEDTGIFEDKLFTNSISQYTQKDGSDLHTYLDKIFAVMNQQIRDDSPSYITKFPYVNGGLFRDVHSAPIFTSKSRQILLENGDLDWSVINPDIFGSMMQAVVDAKQRSGLGMHYTSVPNIMKVIEPLFLNELKEELQNATEYKSLSTRHEKLNQLHQRISKIKIFDPACGSGNFLIIAYKELRILEIELIKQFNQLDGIPSLIHLHNFYGIEIDDFAHEIAKLSLWLAEHQMNMVFKNEFGFCEPALPLKDSGNIVCANACRIEWDDVCPKNADDEIYVLGNPPYLGARYQEQIHRNDIAQLLSKWHGYKSLDYITCWFYNGSNYIKGTNNRLAFVSTNSICQGEQMPIIWKNLFNLNVEINFAYQSFKWTNNAKSNAGVTVVVIGLQRSTENKKTIYSANNKIIVSHITGYLTSGNNIFINKANKPISKLPTITSANRALDNGYLLLSENEVASIINEYPQSKELIKLAVGAAEFLRSIKKYCLWIFDDDLNLALSIPQIKERIEKVKNYRLKREVSGSSSNPADKPHQFLKMKLADKTALFLPTVSSERREYIPIGFLNNQTVIIDPNFAIYDPETWIFGVVSSKMHMAWVQAVAGRLETRIRYSSTLCYNTFPFPNINEEQKKRIEMYVFEVLDEREKYSEKTLAELYDPDKMPDELRQAHHNLDIAIEQCYRLKPFESDEERLEHLFNLYEQMTSKESQK